MKYLDYMADHPDEYADEWCRYYTDGNGRGMIIYQGEPETVINGETEVCRGDKSFDSQLNQLARDVNSSYESYRGWKDHDIALDMMYGVGCADCPSKYICDLMQEEVDEDEDSSEDY